MAAQSFGDDRLGRTESEEKEYKYQQSVEMMRQEKKENSVLLETLKLVQGLDAGTLYEHEISLLRESIRQKHDMINKLHSKGLELSEKTKYLELELYDQQDRTREERERLLQESASIEQSIKDIQDDRQCAVQRLHQYKLLYSRTKEDRDEAEARMLRARELVDMSRDDLSSLKECLQNSIKVSQDACEKKLNSALADFEASKAFWKSSLEKKTREIDAIIRRYNKAKDERTQEEERESKERIEAERLKNEVYEEREKTKKALEQDARRVRHVHREQWGLVCAAAGLEPDAPTSAVIQSYDTLMSLRQSLDSKLLELEHGLQTDTVEEDASVVRLDEETCDTSIATLDMCACDEGAQDQVFIRKDAITTRIKISLLYLQEKMAAFFSASPDPTEEGSPEPASAAERLPRLRRRSSMLALHPRRLSAAHLEQKIAHNGETNMHSGVESCTETNPSLLQLHIDEDQLCEYIQRVASHAALKGSFSQFDPTSIHNESSEDSKEGSSLDQLQCLLPQQRHMSRVNKVNTFDLMGVHGKPVQRQQDSVTALKTPDLGLHKPVLSREDVKARSWKIKAKLDKRRHFGTM